MTHKTNINTKNFKTNRQKCLTCPFDEYGDVEIRTTVQERIFNNSCSQTCHSTNDTTLCRGARDLQQLIYYRMGVIEAPTDEAWDKKREELGV